MADFLFDIGKVLLDFDFESSLVRLLPEDVEDPHGSLERLLEKKDEFEAGRIPVDEYTAWAKEVLESPASTEEFYDAWRNIFTVNEPMWETVRKLHADGHRLILFSNTNGIHCPWIFDEFPEFSLFHGAVLSFEVQEIKPHQKIYDHATEVHDLTPEETLYIDDLPANAETGKRLGFRTHQYDLNDHAAFEKWLAAELGE